MNYKEEEKRFTFNEEKNQIREKFLKRKPRVFNNKFGIKNTNTFKALLDSSSDTFLFDIEGTILNPNIYYELLSKKYYINLFFDICKSESNLKISDVVYFGRNYRRWLTESCIPSIVTKLKESGKTVFALTSGAPSMQKRDRFKEFNINLNGFLFTRGADKGPFLVNFLNKNSSLSKKCCFVDNHLEKILNVKEHYEREFNQSIECFHYTRETIPTVTKFGFINYWKSVIEAIHNGELDILRKRIKQQVLKKRQQNLEKNNSQ